MRSQCGRPGRLIVVIGVHIHLAHARALKEVSRHPETPGCPLVQTLVATKSCSMHVQYTFDGYFVGVGHLTICDFWGSFYIYTYWTYPFFRCCICSKKAKHSKSVSLGEEDYCEPCFRRQYLLRSAIEHFMVSFVCVCCIATGICMQSTNVLFKIVCRHTVCIFYWLYLTFASLRSL